MEVPDEVFAPVACADEGDVRSEELGFMKFLKKF